MTFSNPRYDILQTAPYQTDNNGHPIGANCVGGTSNVQENAVLEPADDLTTPPVVPPGPGTPNIGTVTVNTSNLNPVVGDTVIYTATHGGSATDIVDTFSAPGETFTGGTVTWQNSGSTTVTCVSTSATANDSPRQGSRPVTVGAGGGGGGGTAAFGTLTSTSISDGQALGSNSAYHFNGSPNGCTGSNTSPALAWTMTDDTDVTDFRIEVNDLTNPWLHWEAEVPSTVTSITENADIAALGGGFNPNDWEWGGITGSNANGYGGPCPPGSTHTYRIQVRALNATGNVIASSPTIEFTAS